MPQVSARESWRLCSNAMGAHEIERGFLECRWECSHPFAVCFGLTVPSSCLRVAATSLAPLPSTQHHFSSCPALTPHRLPTLVTWPGLLTTDLLLLNSYPLLIFHPPSAVLHHEGLPVSRSLCWHCIRRSASRRSRW